MIRELKSGLLSIFLIIITIGITGCVGPGANTKALPMLIRLGRNDKSKEQAEKQETKNFRRLKNYIEKSKIKKGVSTKSAISKFGQPVALLSESKGERWAYKPSDANWFGGEKIYLFFDKNGNLVDWECVNCK